MTYAQAFWCFAVMALVVGIGNSCHGETASSAIWGLISLTWAAVAVAEKGLRR